MRKSSHPSTPLGIENWIAFVHDLPAGERRSTPGLAHEDAAAAIHGATPDVAVSDDAGRHD